MLEVLSPSTRQIDRFRKLEEYKTVRSIQYILLVEPTTPAAKLYLRGAQNAWTSTDFVGLDAVLVISDPNLRLPLRDLYEGLRFGGSGAPSA